MPMEDSFTPPPMLKKDENGMWQPVYHPTEEDYQILRKETEQYQKRERKRAACMYWSCFVDTIHEFFRWK